MARYKVSGSQGYFSSSSEYDANSIEEARALAEKDGYNYIHNIKPVRLPGRFASLPRPSDPVTKHSINELLGLCEGIAVANVINKNDISFLNEWIQNHREVLNSWACDILYARIHDALADGLIDNKERKELLGILRANAGLDGTEEDGVPASTLLPINRPEPPVIFKDRRFCLTGIFFFGSREKCENEVVMRGGKTQKNPAHTTDYLVIGSNANPQWNHKNFGTKIEKAVNLRSDGLPIAIITEKHWIDHILQEDQR